jgi:hypothetical protein
MLEAVVRRARPLLAIPLGPHQTPPPPCVLPLCTPDRPPWYNGAIVLPLV